MQCCVAQRIGCVGEGAGIKERTHGLRASGGSCGGKRSSLQRNVGCLDGRSCCDEHVNGLGMPMARGKEKWRLPGSLQKIMGAGQGVRQQERHTPEPHSGTDFENSCMHI